MRILIASDLHWPTLNGIATFGRNLAHGLAERGHEVLVIAPSQTGKKYQEIDKNHIVRRTTSLVFPFYQNFRISVSPYSEVKKIVEEFKPDIIHIQTPLGISRAALSAAKKFNIPLVATNHAMPENLIDNLRLLAPFARPISYILKEYGTRFLNNADYVTLPTDAAIKMFDGNTAMVKVPVVAVSNGIDLSEYKPGPVAKELRERFHIPNKKPIILYIGRLDSEKHLNIVIKALPHIRQKVDAHMVIVGHGNDADNLHQLTRDLDLERHITFTGRVSDEDKYMLYRLGTVFVMPSPAELQSIVVLEAMATGLPIVAVNAGALYELCQNNRNGFLIAVDDEAAMAEQVAKLLQDKKLCTKMSKESLIIAKTHDMQNTLDRYEAIYKEVIKNHDHLVETGVVSS
jgi:glycosyltransferase involved in cell wall biosynthesis